MVLGLRMLTWALDVTAKVGPGGNFLTESHTVDLFRTELYLPRLANGNNQSRWRAQGQPTMADRARDRWQNVLAAHTAPTPDAATVALLNRYVETHTA
jgi:trimethylamine--corrinoid protein Co-methyltransferase